MSVRAPTSFAEWLDLLAMTPGASIITTEPTKVLDEQQLVLDLADVVLSDCFYARRTSSGSFVTVATYDVTSVDKCDDAGVSNDETSHDVHVLAWNSDGSTAGQVRVESANAVADDIVDLTVTTAMSSPTWISDYAALSVKTNGEEDVVTVQIRRTSGSGFIYVAAVGLFLPRLA